jgi:hypothetical protein
MSDFQKNLILKAVFIYKKLAMKLFCDSPSNLAFQLEGISIIFVFILIGFNIVSKKKGCLSSSHEIFFTI